MKEKSNKTITVTEPYKSWEVVRRISHITENEQKKQKSTMDNQVEYRGIDYAAVFRAIWKRKILYVIVIALTIVLSSVYIMSIPRTYSSSTEFAPETESKGTGGGTLGSLASTFGLDMSALESSDAITPMLYPDLLDDNGFISTLLHIHVQTNDSSFKGTLYDYKRTATKTAWWNKQINYITSKISSKEPEKGKYEVGVPFDPYHLTKLDNTIIESIRSQISIKVDKKTGAITINVEDQDPLVAKTLADSTREQLKGFIVKYRTDKDRRDVEYYRKLTEEAKSSYEHQRKEYGDFSDTNTDVTLPSIQSKGEDMENEMQLRYNNYSQLKSQLQLSLAKLRERTPVFTQIKGAAVPVKPTGPKRMLFVLSMTLLTFIATSLFVLRDITRTKNPKI